MVLGLILVVFMAAVAIGWRHATRQTQRLPARVARPDARSSYHCVEVRAGVPACEAARHIGSVRFLSGEAPGLPVSGCTERTCTCRYVHHDDRRVDDRRNPYGQGTMFPHVIERERRARTERRRSQDSAFRPMIAR